MTGADVSPTLMSKITDAVIEQVLNGKSFHLVRFTLIVSFSKYDKINRL